MSDSRNLRDVKTFFQSWKGFTPELTMEFYNIWAETYEQDMKLLDYRASRLTVKFLMVNLSEIHKDVQVLDVACGSGLVAELMSELGFRSFVGVDCSETMLEKAAKTGLYQDLNLALLGIEPLPAQPVSGTFGLMILVGGLGFGFAPVSVVRELRQAAKPGGLVCLARGNHKGAAEKEFQMNLDRELQLMEEEGLWSRVAFSQVDKYTINPQEGQYISGSLSLQDIHQLIKNCHIKGNRKNKIKKIP